MKLLTCLLFVLIVWRMIWCLDWKWYWKILPVLLAGLGAFKFQVFRIVGGHYFAPDLPEWIIMGGAWLYGAFYLLIPLWIICEIVRLCKWRKEQKLWNKVNLGIVAASLLLSCLGMVLGAADPRITP